MHLHSASGCAKSTADQEGHHMKKLPAHFNVVALPFVLSILMSCLVSLIATLRATGFDGFSAASWLQAWGLSWVVAFPALFVMMPLARRTVALLVEKT
jgi:hypothetical protein